MAIRRREIQDIVPPSRRGKPSQVPEPRSSRKPKINSYNTGTMRRESHTSRFGLWVIALLALAGLGLALSLLFSGAKITVFPKQQDILVNATFTAVSEPLIGELGYEVMTLSKTETLIVPATGEEEASLHASGRIVIFNDYNTASQRLIKNTRFETNDGLIFRIRDSITVPGQSVKDGVTVPGSIEVTVYADEVGDDYNIGLTDFTIPGFKGSPRFEGFFARSKTAMTGGFVGTRLTVDPVVLEEKRVEIRTKIREQLLAEAFLQKPDGFQLHESGVFIEFESLPNREQGDEAVEIVEKATLYGILFDEQGFAQYIARNTLAGFDEERVRLRDPADLTITIEDGENQPWEQDTIRVSVQGNTTVIFIFNEDALRADLAGRSKGALTTVLSGYPSIERAEAVVRPFWKRSFPEADDIKIIEMLDE